MADWGSGSIQKQLFWNVCPTHREGHEPRRNETEEHLSPGLINDPEALWPLGFMLGLGGGGARQSSHFPLSAPVSEGTPTPTSPNPDSISEHQALTGTPRATEGIMSQDLGLWSR